nr:hypothetical protein [Pyrobaculum arsenaticum]
MKTAAEHIYGKIKEGKKLSTEDIFLLYLGTIVEELRGVRAEVARLEKRIDDNNKRIDETNRRIDETTKMLLQKIDETNKRIDAVYQLLLEIRQLVATQR